MTANRNMFKERIKHLTAHDKDTERQFNKTLKELHGCLKCLIGSRDDHRREGNTEKQYEMVVDTITHFVQNAEKAGNDLAKILNTETKVVLTQEDKTLVEESLSNAKSIRQWDRDPTQCWLANKHFGPLIEMLEDLKRELNRGNQKRM